MKIDFDPKYLQKHLDKFVAELWQLLLDFGPIAEINVPENLCDHILGSVYVKFESASYAAECVKGLKEKKYNGIILLPQLSPVINFADAECKEFPGSSTYLAAVPPACVEIPATIST